MTIIAPIDFVREFQRRAGLGVDGKAGPATMRKLDEVLPDTRRRINAAGLALIKQFEGLRLNAYPDPATGGDPWTIGIGTTVYPDGRKVKKGDTITEAQALEYLAHDIRQFEDAVARLAPISTGNQFSALVSFTYNLGAANLAGSTLLKKHNAGDYAGAANEFGRWTKGGGRELPGLVKRRAKEAALYQKV